MKNGGGRSSSFCDDRELTEAALAGDEIAVGEVKAMVQGPKMVAMLRRRGASASEADEIITDLLGDCFGGQDAKGGMLRLLGRYGGSGSLGGFLNRVALNRLISLKRKARIDLPIKEESGDEEEGVVLSSAIEVESEDAIFDLLKAAILEAFSKVSQEQLVLFRMVHSYRIPQKRVGEMWGWHESKVSRSLGKLVVELRDLILSSISKHDPWLQLEWEDFLALCGDSVDLFDY